jgi:hypothetical protein
MADMKIPRNLPAPVGRPMHGERVETLRSAQKAFFEAALTSTQASPQKTDPTSPPASPPAAAGLAEPQRYLRPGSRLDIKV